MVVAKKSKAPVAKATKIKVRKDVEEQLELLTPQEYEAITSANYGHPESRVVLRMFLQINYFWHLSRHMQGLPSSVSAVDWKKVEENSAQTIRNTFHMLLPEVPTNPWDGQIPERYKKV